MCRSMAEGGRAGGSTGPSACIWQQRSPFAEPLSGCGTTLWTCAARSVFIQKSTKTLIMNAALGHGSELLIDVAPGVDWTAAVAIVLGIQQVP